MLPHETPHSMVDLPRLVDAWQSESLDEASRMKLAHLLRSSREARAHFLELCQIDAELRWRFASQAQVADTLAHKEGAARPIAAIVLSGLGFRDDAGFPAVFDKVEASEPHAQLWLQVYPVLRACVFMCLPRLSDAEAAVSAICEELADHSLTDLSPERFRRLASDVACRAAGRRIERKPGSITRVIASIVEQSLLNSGDIDVVAAYESCETCVPGHVPADTLRPLCLRYLLELSPAEIAASLNLPEPAVYTRLAEARLATWHSCFSRLSLCEEPPDLRRCSAFSWALDRPRFFEQPTSQTSRRDSPERLLQELEAWIGSRDENRRCFVAFGILHESLYRRLSLYHLLEESKSRREEEFHRVVTDMLLRLEEASAMASPVSEAPRRAKPSRAPAAWLAAIAAALLIAAGAGIWWSGRPPADLPGDPQLAERDTSLSDPAPVEPAPPKPQPAEPPPRTVAAVVKTALKVDGPSVQKLEADSPIFAGERIELAAGILHLSTPSGCEWVLEGPIAMVMNKNGEVSLIRGKLVGRSSGRADPLLVQTPTARVLDRGTEFGVSVGADHATSVAVYDGAVELSSAADGASRAATGALNIDADFEATVRQDGRLPAKPARSAHDRAFIRPDEVELRQQQQRGSLEAAEKVAFFELLRVEGLLAYQGFHGASNGGDLTIGFLPFRAQAPMQFGDDLAASHAGRTSSKSLLLSNGDTTFLDLDVSGQSPLARAGLVDASNLVGAPEAVVWVCWRSRVSLPDDGHIEWTGLSLMHGDERMTDEPVFIGQPAGSAHLGLQIYNGQEQMIQDLDAESDVPGTQARASDNRTHLWVARITFHDAATVSVWCDVDPAKIGSTPAQAEQHIADLKFDRLRLEVSEEGDDGQCAYDEVILTTSREALVAALARRN